MHSFSISQPIDGTSGLLLLPETTSILVFLLGIVGWQLKSLLSLRVVYLNNEMAFFTIKALVAVVPKSYRPKGQPRSTRNEFPIRADFGNSRKHPMWRLKCGEN